MNEHDSREAGNTPDKHPGDGVTPSPNPRRERIAELKARLEAAQGWPYIATVLFDLLTLLEEIVAEDEASA